MELIAVIETLKNVIKNYKFDKIVFFTDSQYVSNLLNRKEKLLKTNFITKSGKKLNNYELIEEFYQITENQNIEIAKIKAHQKKNTGFDLNIFVDKLSRKLVRNYDEKQEEAD